MRPRLLKDAALSGVEFVFLLLLWMIFVGKLDVQEFSIGVAAALMGAVGDAIVKKESLAPFRPRLRWVALIAWEPWYVLKGTFVALRELARTLGGRQPRERFETLPYHCGGHNEVAAAKRALFAAYVTISPDSIVVGLDADRRIALIHQLGSPEVPEVARELGVQA